MVGPFAKTNKVFGLFKIRNFLFSYCGLVVRVRGYRSGGPGSIPGTTRFSEEKKRKRKQ
jgi:hypothetical protein